MMESLREIFFKIDRSTQKLTTGRSTQKLTAGRTHYSMFDVGRSMFDVHQFLFRLDWPFFWPEAALI
jgi:hypothetical protein